MFHFSYLPLIRKKRHISHGKCNNPSNSLSFIRGQSSPYIRYLTLGGPTGLIHWNPVAAWLKNQRFNQTEAYVDIQS